MKGSLLYIEEKQSLCLNCAGFGDLVFLGLLTRAAMKYSSTGLVVVKFSRVRKRYERQGLLVQEEGLQKAENEVKTNKERVRCS